MSTTAKLVFVAVIVGVVVNVAAAIRDEKALSAREAWAAQPAREGWRLKEIRTVRHRAQLCAEYLTGERWEVSAGVPAGPRYRRWVLNLWRDRLASCRRDTQAAQRDPARAIRIVFGAYADEAIRVSRCESHLKTWARNGQYLGLFQMGEYARSTYGHGPSALEQAWAAHRYFVASGRDWSPWQCQP